MLTQSLRQTRGLLLTFCRATRIRQQEHDLVIRCLSTAQVNSNRAGPTPEDGFPPKRTNYRESLLPADWLKLIDKYPDFLPDPLIYSPVLVMREIDDMLKRRTVLEIPDFYVGSVLAVTASDPYAETKRTRFVGICIHRTGQLSKANFTLRNVIDGMGCEVRYELYNPLIMNIEVLRLEKRLDDKLTYLRDALPEYSTFPEDMKPQSIDDTLEVPVNPLRVKMKPQPWTVRWERHLLKGIEKLEDIPEWFAKKVKVVEDDPVYSYDTMLEYRRHCTEETMYNICKRLAEHEKNVVSLRREARARKFLRVAKTLPNLSASSES